MKAAPLALLAAVVAVVHGRALGFGFTSLDDLTLLVSDRAFLVGEGALWGAFGRSYFHVIDPSHAYFRPVVALSYVLDTRAFGGSTVGYHATNLVLHLATTWLAFALLLRARFEKSIALGCSLLFAIHPALLPVVAWIPGRNDSLLAAFVLFALIAHGRARASDERRALWRAAHLASFAFAMFAKETAIVVPLLSIAWARWVERDDARSRPRVDDAATWAGWGLVIALFAFARHRVLAGAVGAAITFDWDTPVRNIFVLVASGGTLLLPVDLAPIATAEDTRVWPGVVALLVLVALVAIARRGAAIRMRIVAFGAAFYGASLVPVLFTPGVLALQNRLYLPFVGILFVLAELASTPRIERRSMAAFVSVTALVLAALTIGHGSAYRDPLAFGKAAVAGAPHSALAQFTLGQARQLRGELDLAATHYAAAIALEPNEPVVHNNLGVIHMRRGEWARAESELEAELRINPGYAVAIENLAIVRRRAKRPD